MPEQPRFHTLSHGVEKTDETDRLCRLNLAFAN